MLRGPGAWLVLGVVISLGCLALACSPAPAQSYSAYSDPEKPAIAFVLSQDSNAEEFRSEFGLDDQKMERVLAAVREENETLARASAESGTQETTASDYNERVREAVARTKSSIEALLTEDQIQHLEEWVDAKFTQEGQEAAQTAVEDTQFSATRSRSVKCKVYATYYDAFSRYEVALPHQRLKFREKHRKVRLRPVANGRGASAPVKEVGPWNTRDNYWSSRAKRDMWDNLPRCVPEAQAAYFDNYHRGRDDQHRIVRNPAGIDLTLAVAKRMGIKHRIQRQGLARVYVRYPWVKR